MAPPTQSNATCNSAEYPSASGTSNATPSAQKVGDVAATHRASSGVDRRPQLLRKLHLIHKWVRPSSAAADRL